MAWSAKERYVARNFGFLGLERGEHTVDGRNPAPVEVDSLSHYLQRVLYISGGCLGFLNHQTVCVQKKRRWFVFILHHQY